MRLASRWDVARVVRVRLREAQQNRRGRCLRIAGSRALRRHHTGEGEIGGATSSSRAAPRASAMRRCATDKPTANPSVDRTRRSNAPVSRSPPDLGFTNREHFSPALLRDKSPIMATRVIPTPGSFTIVEPSLTPILLLAQRGLPGRISIRDYAYPFLQPRYRLPPCPPPCPPPP